MDLARSRHPYKQRVVNCAQNNFVAPAVEVLRLRRQGVALIKAWTALRVQSEKTNILATVKQAEAAVHLLNLLCVRRILCGKGWRELSRGLRSSRQEIEHRRTHKQAEQEHGAARWQLGSNERRQDLPHVLFSMCRSAYR